MYKWIEGGVTAPKGFKANGLHCGIRKNRSKPDLALITADCLCNAASVYTQNKVKGAPITVTQKNLKDGKARAIICNSGIANTCSADGIEKAEAMCDVAAKALNISPGDVVVASTGVIGQSISLEPIRNAIDRLAEGLSYEGSSLAAQAIMTTDTRIKEYAVSYNYNGVDYAIGAIAKGCGMINPNMATMLCFVTTDVPITSDILGAALKECIADTINMVSVDGDTSTNDMTTVLACGLAGGEIIADKGAHYKLFCTALGALLEAVAKSLAKDGEGATKLIEAYVVNARDKKSAKSIAKSIINSPLTKSAIFACDANWGRILCAIGYAEGDFNVDKTAVTLKSCNGEVTVCKNAMGVGYEESQATCVLSADSIQIYVDMNDGDAYAKAWGCDLTYDYVKINAEYRT